MCYKYSRIPFYGDIVIMLNFKDFGGNSVISTVLLRLSFHGLNLLLEFNCLLISNVFYGIV